MNKPVDTRNNQAYIEALRRADLIKDYLMKLARKNYTGQVIIDIHQGMPKKKFKETNTTYID